MAFKTKRLKISLKQAHFQYRKLFFSLFYHLNRQNPSINSKVMKNNLKFGDFHLKLTHMN